jgi:hypothetical protein
MADMSKVVRNINRLIEQGAPEEDIDAYLKSENVPLDQVQRNAKLVLGNPKNLDNLQYDPTQGMGGAAKTWAGFQKKFADRATGVQQALLPKGFYTGPAVEQYRQGLTDKVDEAKRLDAPLMNTPHGKTGYFLGGVAEAAGPMALTRGTRLAEVFNPTNPLTSPLPGVVSGLLDPVGTGDSRTKNALMSGAASAAGYGAGAVINRLGQPVKPSQQARDLYHEGVVSTPGQAVDKETLGGSILSRAEEKSTSIPIVGDIINYGRRRGVRDFNQAALGRAGGHGIGRGAIDDAHTSLNATFENLSGSTTATLDNQFLQELDDEVWNSGDIVLTDNAREILNQRLTQILDEANQNGVLTGQAYKKFRGELNDIGRRWSAAGQPGDKDLGIALLRVANALDGTMQRASPPAVQDAWREARGQWSNLLRVEKASVKSANEGLFTPGQLFAADKELGKGFSQQARGRSPMGAFAEQGATVLGDKVPNSFTTDRALWDALALGGAQAFDVLPVLGGMAAGTGAVYGPRAVTAYASGLYPQQQAWNAATGPLRGALAEGGQAWWSAEKQDEKDKRPKRKQ